MSNDTAAKSRSLVDKEITAAAAKSLQSCPTLCNPIDGSPPGSPVPGLLQARTLEWAKEITSTHKEAGRRLTIEKSSKGNKIAPSCMETTGGINIMNLLSSSPISNWDSPLPCCCSVAKLHPSIRDSMDYSMPGFSVLHCLPEFLQIHVH